MGVAATEGWKLFSPPHIGVNKMSWSWGRGYKTLIYTLVAAAKKGLSNWVAAGEASVIILKETVKKVSFSKLLSQLEFMCSDYFLWISTILLMLFRKELYMLLFCLVQTQKLWCRFEIVFHQKRHSRLMRSNDININHCWSFLLLQNEVLSAHDVVCT